MHSLKLLFCTSFLLFFAQNPGYAQLTATHLQIEGPAQHTCILNLRYYQSSQLAKTVTIRAKLVQGKINEEIEFGFEGIEVFIQATVQQPIQVKLLDQERVLIERSLDQSGLLRLEHGVVRQQPFTPERAKPDTNERTMISQFVQCLREGKTTQPLISSSAATNIEYETLDNYLQAIRREMGAIVNDTTNASEWISWEGNFGARVLAGVIELEKGLSQFELMVVEGKLVDVHPDCPKLSDAWFTQPNDLSNCQTRAEQMIRALFAGNSRQALQLYSPALQQQVSEQEVAELCLNLRRDYGTKVVSFEFKNCELAPYDEKNQSQKLTLRSTLELDTGTRCLAQVDFLVPANHRTIPKIHLAAVNVHQVFPSAFPKLADSVQIVLECLGETQSEPPSEVNTDKRVLELLHPQVRRSIDPEELQELLTSCSARFNTKPHADLDLWTVTVAANRIQASGPTEFGASTTYLETLFVDDALTGFSFYGPDLAVSTLDLIQFDPRTKEIAQEFWKSLLSDRPEQAYSLLAPVFQEQMSAERFQTMVAASKTAEPSELSSVQVQHQRMTDRIDRSLPLMSTVYLAANFSDGSTLPLRCEFAWPVQRDAAPVIFEFSSQFETDFPIRSIPLHLPLETKSHKDLATAVIEALSSFDDSAIYALTHPDQQQQIDRAVLKAYIAQFKEVAGDLKPTPSLARTAVYESDEQLERLNAALLTTTQQTIQLEVWFYEGCIDTIKLQHPDMLKFPEQIQGRDQIDRQLQAFTQSWLGGQIADSQEWMVSELQTPSVLKSLETLRNEFVVQHGDFISAAIKNYGAGERPNQWIIQIDLEGQFGSAIANIALDFDAFGGLVSGISF